MSAHNPPATTLAHTVFMWRIKLSSSLVLWGSSVFTQHFTLLYTVFFALNQQLCDEANSLLFAITYENTQRTYNAFHYTSVPGYDFLGHQRCCLTLEFGVSGNQRVSVSSLLVCHGLLLVGTNLGVTVALSVPRLQGIPKVTGNCGSSLGGQIALQFREATADIISCCEAFTACVLVCLEGRPE